MGCDSSSFFYSCPVCTEAHRQRAPEAQVYHASHQEDDVSHRADRPIPALEIRGTRGGVQLRRLRHVSATVTLRAFLAARGISSVSFSSISQGCRRWHWADSRVELPYSQIYKPATAGLPTAGLRGEASCCHTRQPAAALSGRSALCLSPSL